MPSGTRLRRLVTALISLACIGRVHAQCRPDWHPGPSGSTGQQELSGGLVYASCRWTPDNLSTTPTRVVAAGTFTSAGSTATNRIASWDGTAWYSFGSGMNGPVFSVTTNGNTLFAAGLFSTAGGVACNNIAYWTGTAWQPLGSGLNGSVFAMACVNGILFVGGSFTTAGGAPANHVAAWTGFAWETLGSGVNGNVLTIYDDNPTGVVFGGEFTTAGGSPASHIALYDNSWHPYGGGVSSSVKALARFNGQLYAGGEFADANGTSTFVACLAKWNGSTWSAIQSPGGIGVSSTHVSPRVGSLLVFNNNLYIGGLFDSCAGVTAGGIARLDTVGCHALASGVGPPTGEVNAMSIYEGSVIALGAFSTAGGLTASNVARWNQTEWSRLESKTTGPVLALTTVNGGLVAVGNFKWQVSLGLFARNIAGVGSGGASAFQNSGGFTGTNDVIFAACPVNPTLPQLPQTLVIAGDFTSAGGVAASRIASIGTTFNYAPMGAGFNLPVYAVKQFNNVVYAAGDFTTSGTTSVNKIARYVGGAWVPAGTTGISGGFPNVLETYNGNLYVGGDFTSVDGVNTGAIARWDGSTWHALVGNFAGSVYALAVHNNQLVIAGTFPGSQNSVNILTWDGTAFHPLGVGLGAAVPDQFISAVVSHNGELYAAGKFVQATVSYTLAKWNGLNWDFLDSSMFNDGYIRTLASSGGELWAGGYYTGGSGHFTPFLSRFYCTCYADCDGVGGLTANDFQCFLSQYVFGGSYANCDGTGGLTANDFQCYLGKYVTGCP